MNLTHLQSQASTHHLEAYYDEKPSLNIARIPPPTVAFAFKWRKVLSVGALPAQYVLLRMKRPLLCFLKVKKSWHLLRPSLEAVFRRLA
jgi:hypothetical protein